MARLPLAAFILAGAAVAATPALAQFGNIFSDPPPRPPASVPRGGNADVPPAQPLPAPMSLPPQSRPGAGAIQSQPLAPPPGATAAPPPRELGPPQDIVAPAPPAGEQPAPGQATLPGLPPGQRQPRGTPQPPQQQQANTPPQQPADTSPQPGDEVVVEPPPQKIANPQAVFAGLDKITGRIISFDVNINETVQFGALQVTPRACYTRPPTETPNTDAFIEVDEVTLQGETKRIFTGWMFAASPGLHAVEHPIYDVWLTDCKGGQPAVTAEAPPVDAPPPGAAVKPPAARPTPPAPRQPRGAPPPQQQMQQQQQPGFLPALR